MNNFFKTLMYIVITCGVIVVVVLLVFKLTNNGTALGGNHCDEGDILKGNTCIVRHSTPAQITYDCSNYTRNDFILRGDKCCAQNSNIFCYPAAQKYNCPSGFLEDDECIIETTYPAY